MGVKEISETQEFNEGYFAYQIGLRLNDNPYDWHESAGRWGLGWEEAWLDDK